jgi:hypothetical protein
MDKELIIQLMADAGLKPPARGDFIFIHWDQIAMLLAHEREQCAMVCETHAPTTTPTWVSYATAIRARSNP